MRRRPSRALLRGEVRTSPKPAFFKQIGGGESLATTADWKPPVRCTILVLKSNETLQLSKYRRDGNALVFEQLDGTKGVVDMDLVDWRRTTARNHIISADSTVDK